VSPEARRRRVFVGVAALSLATLILELTLTRLFSATMFYHFAFLAISLALFGSGASGVLIYVIRPRLDDRAAARGLALCSAFLAVSSVAALLVILSHPLSPVAPGLHTLKPLSLIYGAAALPFFFSGCAITLAIAAYARDISRLYLFDLAGAALGCLLLMPALSWLGAVDTVLCVAVLAAAAALVLGGRAVGRAGVGVLVLLLFASLALVVSNQRTGYIGLREAKGLSEAGVLFSRWNSFSRVTVGRTADPDRMLIFIDADAATVLHRDGADLARHQAQRDRIEALAYHVGGRDKVLVIGPGGGVDVIIARLFGASDVTAVEVNPLVARDVMSAEPFLSYSGRLYEQPGFRLVVDEARSFLRRSRESYDLILGTMVDTWAATAAGAFALTENNLYTTEAFSDYLSRLAPDGILSMTRWHQNPPDQLLRLVSLSRSAMAEAGLTGAAERFVIVRGVEENQPLATTTVLFKRSAFTPDEVARAEAFAERLGYDVLYSPRTRPDNDFTRLIEAEDPAEVWRSFPSDIAPPSDDRPFFFQSVRLSRLLSHRWARGEWRKTNLGTVVLFSLVGITAAVVAVFILGPLLLVRRRLRASPEPGRLAFLVYFACLGAGFILIEIVLIQKAVLFLGHPAYALSVVLFALLLFSGIGARLSGAFAAAALPRAVFGMLLAVVVLVLLSIVAIPPVFYGLVHLGAAWRVGITVLLLAPLGLALGMPMPTGIRLLAERAPGLIPWAWGLNGAASVMGSVGAIALGMTVGFDRALLAGAGLYLGALALVAWALAASAGTSVASARPVAR
jgi:spermidine synthase